MLTMLYCNVLVAFSKKKQLCDQTSLVGLCTQDYKSLFAVVIVVIICATLVNKTDTQTSFRSVYMNSSAS